MRFALKRGWPRQRRLLGGIAAGILAIGTAVTVTTAISGAVVSGSPSAFEASDGNMTVEAANAADWNCFANGAATGFTASGTHTTESTGTCSASLDDSNALAIHPDANNGANGEVTWKAGQKLDASCASLTDNGSVPNKDDFTGIASYVEQGGSPTDTFLYGGEIRAVANGNSSSNLELSQNKGTAACPITRTAGDKLLAFDFTGGGTSLDFHALTWITPANPSAGGNSGTCDIGHDSPPCWGAKVVTSGAGVTVGGCGTSGDNVEGCSNQSAIAGVDNGIDGTNLATNQFAEFGVNLTVALGLSGCNAFTQQTWESRSSGSSFTSNPEDIEVETQPISICGSITIIKHTNPRGESQSFGFTTSSNLIPSPSTFSLNDSCAVAKGSTANNSPDVSTASSFFTVGEGITDSLGFIPAGTTVVSTGAGGTTAVLSANATGTSSTDQFTVNSCAGNTETFSNEPAGVYTVSENTAPGGYAFDNVTCTDNGAAPTNVVTSGQQVTITLNPNDNVICTYVNDALGTITIVKHTDARGADTAQSFSYTSDITGNAVSASTGTAGSFSLSDDGTDDTTNTETITGVPAGTWNVTEGTEPTGWTLESLSCTPSSGASSGTQDSPGSAKADITLAAGGSVKCTYQNKQPLGAIQITKETTKASAALLNGATFEVCTNPGPYTGGTTCTSPSGVTNPIAATGTSPFSAGTTCVAGLPWFGASGTNYYVQEVTPPAGYAADATYHEVNVDMDGTCTTGSQATLTVKDVPLTDLTITATSEATGGTSSTITCTPQGSATNIGNSPQSGSTATVTANDTSPNGDALEPGIYTCTVNVDP